MKKKLIPLIFILLFIGITIYCILFFYQTKDTSNIEQDFNYVINLETETKFSELTLEEKNTEINSFNISLNRDNVVTTPATPFHSPDGWSSNVLGINDGSAVLEIYNNSSEPIFIDNSFIMYLGVNADDTPVESKITTGYGKLEPHTTTTVTVTNGGDAKYLKVGFGNRPKDWAFYPVKSFMDRVNLENQIMYTDTENSTTYELTATISPHKFKDLNIGTLYSRKINKNSYLNLKLSKQEKNIYPYSTLGYIKVDIYNKSTQNLIIDNIDLLYKNNNKIINSETLTFNKTIYSEDCQILDIPFKYLGGNITTTIILKTNFGNITIHQPEILFGTLLN